MAIINGNNLPNILVGTNAGDAIKGFGGNDQLYGLGGDDLLIGGPAADLIDGGAGYDLASYFYSTAGVTVSLATGVGSGGEAQGDKLLSIEDLEGSQFNDHLTGNAGSNVLFGDAGNDSLNGAAGDDYLLGGSGADVITGGAGYDLASYFYSTAGVTVSVATGVGSGGEAQDDKLFSIEDLEGSKFNDQLTGNAGSNFLIGNSGSDSLYGAAGDDYLFGGSGADVIDGGTGYDLASYFYSTAGVTVSLAGGVGSGGEAQGDQLLGVEALAGSKLNDHLTGDAGSNFLFGSSGSDSLRGAAGDDYLFGGFGADVIDGGAGDDLASYFYSPAAVAVSLATGASSGGEAQGDKLLSIEDLEGSNFSDHLTGDAGSNHLFGNAGNDSLNGLAGDDWLYGGAGGDSMSGGAGNDTLNGGPGTDTMRGGAGDDTYFVGAAGDVVIEQAGAGIDRIVSSISTGLNFGGRLNVENLTLAGTAINGTGNALGNVITGNGANNLLIGLGGNDRLVGGIGADNLQGGAGNDTHVGGAGIDTITTGAGFDTILFDAPLGAANADRILDFAPAFDTILLKDAVFAGLPSGVLAATDFVIGTAAGDATDRIVYNPVNGNLFFDPDGTGATPQQLFADLGSGLAMTAADFFVI